jgi:hypothetical protein
MGWTPRDGTGPGPLANGLRLRAAQLILAQSPEARNDIYQEVLGRDPDGGMAQEMTARRR